MDKELTFVGHLEELRRRIIISLAALGLASVISLPFASWILKVLKAPASGIIGKLAYFGPQDAFLIYMKVGLMAGLVIAFPVIAYQLWKFISPAVEDRFKRYAVHFIIASSAAFLMGCLFAYFVLLPAALNFLLSFGSEDLEPVISAGQYISFTISIILCSGLVFEMPVLSFILARIGLINAAMLKNKWKVAVVAIFVAAAVITPTTDIFNMIILAVPMLLLYVASIWVASIARRSVK
jgi:sec-independent protein translocase protein TatC